MDKISVSEMGEETEVLGSWAKWSKNTGLRKNRLYLGTIGDV